MNNFFKRKLLFLSEHNISFGDGLCAIDRFDRLINDDDLVHYCITPITLSCLSWYLESIQCDRIVPQVPNINYDVVVIENFYSVNRLDELKQRFANKIYRGQSCIDKSLPGAYENGLAEKKPRDRLNKILCLGSKQKKLCLFPFSTRPLASIGIVGINKICEYFTDYDIYLCGEIFNPYSQSRKHFADSISDESLNQIDDRVINLLGLGTKYTIQLANHADLNIMAPTGIAMLPILQLIRAPVIIPRAGDSNIMNDIYKHLQKDGLSYINFHQCNCQFYPCQDKLDEKALICLNNEHALCLNEELTFPEL